MGEVSDPTMDEPQGRPETPPADRPTPPTPATPNGNRGVLDCPTVDAPPFTGSAENHSALSTAFSSACATCHGPNGRGTPGYPELPGALTEGEFIDIARRGRAEAMPAFDAAFVSDATLAADYQVLSQISAGTLDPDTLQFGNEWDWSDAEYETARAEGLVAWRTPDADGVACANCHTPDAIDLALLGYPDHAIIRRGRLHLDPVDTVKVAKFIHAQRRHFNITEPCHPSYRPLQPGGEVLPGDTAEEQDAAFGASLRDRELLLAAGTVRNLEDAEQAIAEVQAIDTRTLPIGIPLPRWTEDGFNGHAHATLNDYMPPIGLRPTDEHSSEWYALEDAYVADPTDEALFVLLEEFETMNWDGGFRDAHPEDIGNCRRYRQAGDYLYDLARRKRRSQLITQHLLRRALLGGEGLDWLGAAPFAEFSRSRGEGLNPFYSIGGEHAEEICYSATGSGKQGVLAILGSFPDDVVEETPQSDLANGVLAAIPTEIAHPWFTLAQIYDPALMMRQSDQATNKLHYWQVLKFDHEDFHMPFFAVHRVSQQAKFYEELRGTDAHPEGTFFGSGVVHPFLDGNRIQIRQIAEPTIGSGRNAGDAHRMIGNSIRAVLLKQIALLEAGGTYTNEETFRRQSSTFRRWATRLSNQAGQGDAEAIRTALGDDLELYTSGIEELCGRVDALITAAPRDDSQRETGSR
ncbi:MAG: cytochrome c [Myxococcota bacterium]